MLYPFATGTESKHFFKPEDFTLSLPENARAIRDGLNAIPMASWQVDVDTYIQTSSVLRILCSDVMGQWVKSARVFRAKSIQTPFNMFFCVCAPLGLSRSDVYRGGGWVASRSDDFFSAQPGFEILPI